MRSIEQQEIEFLNKVSPFFTPLELYFRYQVVDLQNIRKGPAILVINHGIFPFHGFLLAKKIIYKLGIVPRGLGARFLFSIPYVRDFFLKGGAVNANPRNAKALLKQGNLVMLAPGGIYEALVTRPRMRRIPWERRQGFVKIACEMNAPIIPSYCPGINNVYFNSQFLLWFRIKMLEKIRFSLPFFLGLGFLPFPIKLVHYIGKPISTRKRRGETEAKRVERVHQEVLVAMKKLRDQR